MRLALLFGCFALATALACDEFEDPPPTAPTVPDIPNTQFEISGRWDGQTNQGRPLRFDVRTSGNIVQATISIHHDCSGGRLVLQLSGYETKVSGDSFSATVTWRRDQDGDKYYTGTLTVSGRFEGNRIANGSFVNGITDKQADNLGVCEPSSGSWEAARAE